ncbi:MAG: DUF3089 domain-containing protein [Pseudomonadota bacterium]
MSKLLIRAGAGLMALVLLAGCASQTGESAPTTGPTGAGITTANNYRDGNTWLCRPGRQDYCAIDLTTSVVEADGTIAQESWQPDPAAPVDCFYVYPTVSNDLTPNSDMNAGPGEISVIAAQFARFAAVCRPFAPLYRQVTLTALRAGMAGTPMAVDRMLGYNDVKAAWEDYLTHDNQGRGVVLIGHSQGSGVLTQLIANEIEGKPIQDRIVSALLIGTRLSVPRGKLVGGSFQHLPLCTSAAETGCVISYASFRDTIAPPADSLFGRVPGDEMVAACNNPAALGGGSAPLHAYLAAAGVGMSSGAQGAWVQGKTIATPFVSVPGLLSAECVDNERGAYLSVTLHGNPDDPRTDDIAGDVMINGEVSAGWGLHLIDMHLAMGNLIDVVHQQAHSWTR